MPVNDVFDANAARYDQWFERHRIACWLTAIPQ